jgi:hypothetical protein
MHPISWPVSFNTKAHTWSLLNTVLMISRLSSADLCGGHPARGPTSGSDASRNSSSRVLAEESPKQSDEEATYKVHDKCSPRETFAHGLHSYGYQVTCGTS